MEIPPRQFGQVLNAGMSELARVWRRLFAPTFWSFLPVGALTLAAFALTGADEVIQLVLADPAALERMDRDRLLDALVRLVQGASIAVGLQLLATGFVSMTAHRLVAADIAGQPTTTRSEVMTALARMPAFVIAGLIVLVGIAAGLVLLIVPGIWLAVAVSMVTAVIAIEGGGPVSALRRSHRLVRGRWWPTIGYLLLVGLLGSVAAQLVQLVAVPVLVMAGAGIGTGLVYVVLVLVQGMVTTAIAVMLTLWYVDLRARKEPLLSSSLILSRERGAPTS